MIVSIDGLKVYYEAIGQGAPLLLLHGWGTDTSSMRPIMMEASQRIASAPISPDVAPGCRSYALDFPGFGFSERPASAWDVGQYALFIMHFLQTITASTGEAEAGSDAAQLSGGSQTGAPKPETQAVDILGHSFGGRVAIKLAAQYPQYVRRLVLVDSAGIRPPRTWRYYLKVGLAKTARRLGSFTSKVLPGNTFSRLAERQGSRDYRQAGEMRQTFVKVVNEDLRSFLPSIRCPTLIIWGESDQETPLEDARQMQALIQNSRLEVIPGAGHFPFIEKPAAFNAALFPFLGLSSPGNERG